MPNFSLINVMKEHEDGSFDGYWIEDCNGVSFEEAIGRAVKTNMANSNKLTIYIVPQVSTIVPQLCYFIKLKKADKNDKRRSETYSYRNN